MHDGHRKSPDLIIAATVNNFLVGKTPTYLTYKAAAAAIIAALAAERYVIVDYAYLDRRPPERRQGKIHIHPLYEDS